MKINKIWEELENDNSFSHGLLFRRYSSSVLPDVFIALKLPEKYRCIATSIKSTINLDLNYFSNLKDIDVQQIPDEKKPEKNILILKLLSNQHRDIFSVLCEDLISNISSITNEAQLIKELLNRFEKWKSLFDKASSNGLSPEQQRGLFGELFFIRKFMQFLDNFQYIINSWVGPEKQIRDFQTGTWAVEVKTTHGNNHQKVHISSERQLDTSHLKNLFLYHLSLEDQHHSGLTLNQLVDRIFEILKEDYISLNRFKSKLFQAGYFDHQKNLYDNIGYSIRQESYYKVENDFPRIEENDIRNGVGDVKYSIILSQCLAYSKNEQDVFQKLFFLDE